MSEAAPTPTHDEKPEPEPEKKCTGCEERARMLREMYGAANKLDTDKFYELAKQFSQSLFDDTMAKVRPAGARSDAHAQKRAEILALRGLREIHKP